ncbi:hypothetical protein Aperf_G00000130541 [Anoplocephala perfoliata]
MFHKLPKPENIPISASEEVHDNETVLCSRSPLLPVHNNIESPDATQKKLISEVRSLSSKLIELRNYCDDIESENRELLQNKGECANLITLLEEKCRYKDGELNELRDSCSQLEILRSEYEKMKNELVRVTAALKNAQEINETVDSLKKENEELLKENSKFKNRIKVLEADIERLEDEEGYKPLYEQVREALTTAEKTLSELLLENERAREVSEAEILNSTDKSNLLSWARISQTCCTCTCHHNSITHSRFNDTSVRCSSIISEGNSVDNTTSVRSNDQSILSAGSPSVIDVSLWRDVRTGPSPNDISGECLGEVMAQDAKILELQAQLKEARSEISHLNEEISKLTSQHTDLVIEHKVELNRLELKLLNLASEKQALEDELDIKCTALKEVNNRVELLSAEKTAISENLELAKGESQVVLGELDRLKLKLDEANSEKAVLSEKMTYFEREVAQLTGREKTFTAANCEMKKKLIDAQEDLLALQEKTDKAISALELKVNVLLKNFSESQNQIKLMEALRDETSERLESQLKNELELEAQKNKLVQELSISKKAVDDFSARNKKLLVDLDEKVNLIEHLKTERADLLKERAAAVERGDGLESELLQAHEKLSQLTNELNEAMACAIRTDQLESSLRTRESDVSALNQLIQDYKSTISLLEDEKSTLESSIKVLKSDLDLKNSTLSATMEERDKAKEDLAKRLHGFSEEKACILFRLKSLESDLANSAKTNTELTERFKSTEQELSDCVKELSLKEGEIINLRKEIAGHVSEIANLQTALDGKASLAESLQEETVSLMENEVKLRAEVAKHQQAVTILENENSSLMGKLKTQSFELMSKEAERIRLQDQLASVTADQSRLVTNISELENDRAKLVAELESNMGQKHFDNKVKHLKRQLSLVRVEQMDTEQNLAEARKNASLAEMHQQVAEKEAARLNTFVNVLQRRLDALTEERLACEERAASEAVRCRQLEGRLSEKEAVIEGLRHQLNQLDIQRRSAQEKEALTLREYLKSRAEADRLLALFGSCSTDMRRSYYSLDQLVNPNSSIVHEFLQPGPVRRHSDVHRPSKRHDKRDVDMDSVSGRSIISQKFGSEAERETDQSSRFEKRSPVPAEDLVFRSPTLAEFRRVRNAARLSQETHDLTFVSCLEEPVSTPTPIINHSPALHFIEEADVTVCTPVALQETDTCETTTVISPLKPQDCKKSLPINVTEMTDVPVAITEAQEMPRCVSAASNTITTDTDTISELDNWPPYGNCVAPLSPQALRADGFFTVPSPFEVHYRRLRRLMIIPAAEEDAKLDANSAILETKLIITGIDESIHPRWEKTSIHQPILTNENTSDHSKTSTKSADSQLKDLLGSDSPVVDESIKTEIESRLHLFKARTAHLAARPASMVDHGNENSSRFPSIFGPPAVKLARFRSVQDLCNADTLSDSHQQSSTSFNTLDKKVSRGGPPSSFNRFKYRFVNHHHKNKDNTNNINSLSGRQDSVENVSEKGGASMQSSSKPKKHVKLRLSNVFKAKKHKW